MTHTPGPWLANEHGINTPDGRAIATAWINVGSRDEREANATLIALAPDMLALLSECAAEFDGDRDRDSLHTRLCALLDRVKG
jgi:hypothetical protein